MCGPRESACSVRHDRDSLFDPMRQDKMGEVVGGSSTLRESHLRNCTEHFSQQRFAAFWFDYVSAVDSPDVNQGQL